MDDLQKRRQHNKMLTDRIRGMPAQPASPESDADPRNPSAMPQNQEEEILGVREYYQGKMREVVDPARQGWWRFNKHYDRDGYCDNPARGY